MAPNVIPPAASAQILIRTVEPTGTLKSAIEALLAPGVTVDFRVELPFYKGGAAPAGLGDHRGQLRQRSAVPGAVG